MDSYAPLNDSGIDFSNATDAGNFLDEILDDTFFLPQGELFAQYFWYGIAALIGLATLSNIISYAVVSSRYVSITCSQLQSHDIADSKHQTSRCRRQ